MTEDLPFTPKLLERCISCGYCLPACPTYSVTNEEASSPRGRINLMRAVQIGELSIEETLHESSYCLGCRACESVCPAGVEYGTLLEEWRSAAWQGKNRPLLVKFLLFAVNSVWRVRLLGVFNRSNYSRKNSSEYSLMLGCFERGLFPQVSVAARQNLKINISSNHGCCGALHAHNGELERGKQMAKDLGQQLNGKIVTTSGGCAAHLASVLGKERVFEFSEIVSKDIFDLKPVLVNGKLARVALQDSCHLRHGLQIYRQPREILKKIADYVELPGASDCCGAAGTYAILRPKDSSRVFEKKAKEIEKLNLDFIVSVNPGCTRQLKTQLKKRRIKTKVLHMAEFVALSNSVSA
jgi:glycolate oxidase iron-sulfur subunit